MSGAKYQDAHLRNVGRCLYPPSPTIVLGFSLQDGTALCIRISNEDALLVKQALAEALPDSVAVLGEVSAARVDVLATMKGLSHALTQISQALFSNRPR